MNLTSIHENMGLIPGVAMTCVGCRCGSDLVLEPHLIQPLAWELPYATGTALKRQKKEKESKKGRKRREG